MSALEADLVFRVDIDNTLLGNDRIQADIRTHLEQAYGCHSHDRCTQILQQPWAALGYRDHPRALQRCRAEHTQHVELLAMSA